MLSRIIEVFTYFIDCVKINQISRRFQICDQLNWITVSCMDAFSSCGFLDKLGIVNSSAANLGKVAMTTSVVHVDNH